MRAASSSATTHLARVTLGVDLGRARRNRGAPTPRPAPRGRTRAPTYPGRTVASPGPPALVRAPTADRPSRSTASALARCLARRARPAPRRGWGPPLDPGPAPPGSGRTRPPSPIAVNGSVAPRQQRRNHESWTNTRWRRVSTADHSPPTRWCSQPPGIPRSRSTVAAQPVRSCRKACRRSAGSAERNSSRTGCRRSSSASTYDVTSTPLTTRLLTSPSMTASCITTPIRRARVKSHSRNSASVRSWSLKLAMPGSIHRRTDSSLPRMPGRPPETSVQTSCQGGPGLTKRGMSARAQVLDWGSAARCGRGRVRASSSPKSGLARHRARGPGSGHRAVLVRGRIVLLAIRHECLGTLTSA